MADDPNLKIPQISRSGRILKKSAKLKESEESAVIDEAAVRKRTRRKSVNQNIISATGTSRAFQKTKHVLSSAEMPSIVSQNDGENFVPSLKITKLLHTKENDDPTYCVEKCSAKNISPLKSTKASESVKFHSSESSENAGSSDSTSVSCSSESTEESSSGSTDSTTSSSSSSTSTSDSSVHDVSTSEYRNMKQQRYLPSFDENSKLPAEEGIRNECMSLRAQSGDGESEATDSEAIVETVDELAPKYQTYETRSKVPRSTVSRGTPRRNVARSTKRGKQTATVKSSPKLTSFMLWNNANRKRIFSQYRHLSLSEISKKVGEAWRALPEKEKALWKSKAKKASLKRSTIKHFESGTSTEYPAEASSSTATISNDDHSFVSSEKDLLGLAPIDVAAHLKLIGGCLENIGEKFMSQDLEPSLTGAYTGLLDASLCAIGSLLCLSREIVGLEHLPKETFRKTLNHIGYFLPGLE